MADGRGPDGLRPCAPSSAAPWRFVSSAAWRTADGLSTTTATTTTMMTRPGHLLMLRRARSNRVFVRNQLADDDDVSFFRSFATDVSITRTVML
jgi:hypothetical protein